MIRRISRGNPYIQTPLQYETFLRSITPEIEEGLRSMLNLDKKQWKKLPKPLKVKALIDFQETGITLTTLTAAAKARTDFQEATSVITASAERDMLRDEVDSLRSMLEDQACTVERLSKKQRKALQR